MHQHHDEAPSSTAAADDDDYAQNPFPCEHKGCKKFHSDDATGLCKDHGGGRPSDYSTSSVRVPSLSVLEHHAKRLVEKGQILLLTVVMATIETDNKGLLALFSSCVIGIICLNVYKGKSYYDAQYDDEKAVEENTKGIICLVAVLLLFVTMFVSMWSTTYLLEGMERSWKQYDDAYAQELHQSFGGSNVGSSDDEAAAASPPAADVFGPEPRINKQLRQPTELDFRGLYAAARRNEETFRRTIMEALCCTGRDGQPPRRSLGPAIKGTRRAKEKIRLDYGGDCHELKDILRGTIYCDTLAEVCVAWAELERLQEKRLVIIEQVKNRFHPHSSSVHGYR